MLLNILAFKMSNQTTPTKDHGRTVNSNRGDIQLGFILAGSVIVLWIISWVLMIIFIKNGPNGTITEVSAIRGQFGDQFGAVNALFSGLAFAGIIFTILLQRRDLSLQREELEETRKEFIQQNETLKKQRFENTFFQLLNLHIEIISKLKMRASVDQEVYDDREFFVGSIKELKFSSSYKYFRYSALNKLDAAEITRYKLNREIEHDFYSKLDKTEIANLNEITDAEIDNFISEPIENKESNIRKDYETFFHKFQYNLGHYFRNVYHIFKYVHTTNLIEDKEKQFYCNIVRAQFSTDELVLIFYNSLTPISYYSDTPNLGYPNFKFLIDKYDILQNINNRLLLDKAHEKIFQKNKVEEPLTFKILKDE